VTAYTARDARAGKDTSMPPETITRKAPTANSPGTTMALARSTRLFAVKNWPLRTWMSRQTAAMTRKT